MLRFIALGIAAAVCVGAFPLHAEEPKDGELKSKVNALEAEVAVLKTTGAKAPKRTRRQARTYTVRSGDTLSAIAAGLGIGDWRPLYDANKNLIGPDPDLIQPGQVLTIPA